MQNCPQCTPNFQIAPLNFKLYYPKCKLKISQKVERKGHQTEIQVPNCTKLIEVHLIKDKCNYFYYLQCNPIAQNCTKLIDYYLNCSVFGSTRYSFLHPIRFPDGVLLGTDWHGVDEITRDGHLRGEAAAEVCEARGSRRSGGGIWGLKERRGAGGNGAG